MDVVPAARTAETALMRELGRLRAPGCAAAWTLCALALCAAGLQAQTAPAATASGAAATTPAAQDGARPGAISTEPAAMVLHPLAVVPLDKSLAGAALEVAGSMQAWNGRAYLTGSGSITAGEQTAEVALPSRGTLRVCASGTVRLAVDASAPAGETPGLLAALDRGAVEMSLAASAAREKNADTLLTPYFRILIGGPNPADVKVRLGDQGDTCVDNAGSDAPYVIVSSVFDGGVYRVQPGQRVMFERGSLRSVVDDEKEPCGCPPPAPAGRNGFPLAESEGLAAAGAQIPLATASAGNGAIVTSTLSYSGADAGRQSGAAVKVAATAPAAPMAETTAAKPTPARKKTGLLARIGHFFQRIFGAE